jgi:hypothetical protein
MVLGTEQPLAYEAYYVLPHLATHPQAINQYFYTNKRELITTIFS